MLDSEPEPPYDGAKPMIPVTILDDKTVLQNVVEEMWNQAHRKRPETGVLQVKTHSLEHEHILSGIFKCPVCGSGMYGNVNRKKHPDGGYYKDYFYYACKHRKLVDGHRCTYKRQWIMQQLRKLSANL